MRRSRRGIGWSFLLALSLLILAAGVVAAIPIEGTLGPSSALRAEGTFTVAGHGPGSLVASWNPAVPPLGSITDPARYSLTVREARWRSGNDGLPLAALPGATPRAGLFQDFHQYELDQAQVEVLDIGLVPHWVVTSTVGGPVTAALGPVAKCAVTPGHPETVSIIDPKEVPIPTRVWSSPAPSVAQAKCSAAEIVVVGPSQLVILGSTLRVRALDPISKQPVELEIATGHSKALVHGAQGQTDHRYVEATLVTERPGATFTLPGGPIVALQAAEAFVEGSLQIPEGGGGTRWGEAVVEAHGALRPSGSFHVSASGDQLVFRGDASEAFRKVAIGAGVLAAAAAAWKFGVPPLQGLFTRIAEDKVLQHPRRRAIMDAVSVQPGISSSELVRLLGFSRRSVEYHLAVLVRSNSVTTRRFGRLNALFIFGRGSSLEHERIRQLRQTSVKTVLEALEKAGHLTQRDLVGRLGMSQSRISAILAGLRSVGVIEARRVGRTLVYRPRSG